MRKVTLYLDIERGRRGSSIIEEVTEVLRNADDRSKRYLNVSRIECGAAKTVDGLTEKGYV